MNNKFTFYEVVIIDSDDPSHQEINQWRGTVLGMTKIEEDDSWNYAVLMETSGICWSIEEQYLRKTGEFLQKEDIYDGEVLKVEVDPITKNGKIK